MTNREVVSKLQQLGYSITYVERNDGSIRVERIVSPRGKVKYDKSTSKNPSGGNNKARQIVGEKLTEKQIKQRKKVNTKKSKAAKAEHKKERAQKRKEKQKAAKKKKEALSKSIEKDLKKAQKKLKEAGLDKLLTKKRVRKFKAKEGLRRAKRAIKNIVQHEMGYAYSQSVADLIEYLKVNFSEDGSLYNAAGTNAVIKALKPFAEGRKLLRDKIVADIYDIYYDVKKYCENEGGIPPLQGSAMALDLIKNN